MQVFQEKKNLSNGLLSWTFSFMIVIFMFYGAKTKKKKNSNAFMTPPSTFSPVQPTNTRFVITVALSA
jgi:hypothetical protein